MVKKSIFIAKRDYPAVLYELLQKNFDIVCWDSDEKPSKEQLIQNVKGKFGIVCTCDSVIIDEEVVEAAGDTLKVVSTVSVGLDHLDIEKLKSKKIRIGNTPNVLDPFVAEYAVGLLLATSRRIVEAHLATLRGDWIPMKNMSALLSGHELYKSTVAVVGCGRIGTCIVKRLKSFDPKRIFYYARSRKLEAEELGAKKESLDFIMKESDFIIVVLDQNAETKGIINKDRINSMKSNAILVNVGRGGLLDEDALIEALKNKKIAGAGLDVYVKEPLPADSPFNKMNNVVLSPHIAGNSDNCMNSMGELAALNVIAVLKGTKMPAEVL